MALSVRFKYSAFTKLSSTILRNFSLSSVNHLKEIKEIKTNDTLVVKGEYVPSPRQDMVIPQLLEARQNGERFCPQCTLGLDIKHTDVLILSQYVRSDGCMLPRRITGLCKRQQRRMGALVTMAQKAGLMPNLNPATSKRDPKQRYQWKKYNKYFDEQTIKC
ncbi:28S ribosomal protein S18a, mitochondrial [Anopheles maculipalpis]|uniref:28S ribosomal protein S18a, mitochondrial n=1 Tax=Anopheles maculipalpis TaxID=1496333 RepID=UPI0021593AAD|nr:28S ribosomal protein S18a, mitochondrial [Anopheles maculipalpis]